MKENMHVFDLIAVIQFLSRLTIN